MTVLTEEPASAPAPAAEPRNPLRERDYRWLWSSTVAASTAQGMERTATSWLALTIASDSNGALAVGLVLAARWAPFLIFGLPAGTLADRVYRPHLLRAVSLSALVLVGIFAVLVNLNLTPLWLLVAVSFTLSSLQAVDGPARQALAVDTVPRAIAPNALALNQLAARLLSGVGAFIAGGVIAVLGISSCYVLIAGAFAVAALLSGPIHAARVAAGSERPPFRQALKDAAMIIVSNRQVRTLTIAIVVCEIFGYSHITAVPVLARDVLHAGPEGFGLLNGASSLGGAVMLLLLLLVPSRIPRQSILGTTYVVFGVILILLALARELWVAAALLFVIGACMASVDTLNQTLLQMAVPEEQRGRAVGIWFFGIGSAPIGHLELGILAGMIGAPGAVLVNGVIVLGCAVGLLARAPDFRWRRATSP